MMMKQRTRKGLMGKDKGHIPIRTCLSCGAKRGKKDLIRLILDARGLVVRDCSGSGQGRGAYVCPARDCWDKLEDRGRLNRAFRTQGPLAFHPERSIEFTAESACQPIV